MTYAFNHWIAPYEGFPVTRPRVTRPCALCGHPADYSAPIQFDPATMELGGYQDICGDCLPRNEARLAKFAEAAKVFYATLDEIDRPPRS